MLGGFTVIAGAPVRLPRKAQAVTGFLALQCGLPQSREKLAALFWENSPEEQARTNLRQCLSKVRKSFGPALRCEDARVWFDPDLVDVDAELLRNHLLEDKVDSLEQALEIYRGDLLDGLVVKENTFEDWLRLEREQLRALILTTLSRHVARLEGSGDYGTLASLAARLVFLDPLNEAGHRALIKSFAAQRRYTEALKQYKLCQNTLREELDVAPQAETEALYRQVKATRTGKATPRKEQPGRPDIREEFKRLEIDITPPVDVPSIVLLPFTDLSPERNLSHLAEGIRIDIQSALVKMSGLLVIAAGTAAFMASKTAEPADIAQEVGVHFTLDGTLQNHAGRMRLTVNLTDCRTSQIVWSETCTQALEDPLRFQDDIIRKIVTRLDVKLVRGEQARIWRKTLKDPKALEAYYRGLDLLTDFNADTVDAALRNFLRVCEITPEASLGPTHVALCHYWRTTMGWAADTDRSIAYTVDWAQRAADMEDADGQAHASLAHAKLLLKENESALSIAQEAIRIRPLCANTNALAANVLLHCARPKEAAERVRKAIRLAPVYASWWLELLASAYMQTSQYEKAEITARELVRKRPDDINGLALLAGILVAKGDRQAALEMVEKVRSIDPDFCLGSCIEKCPQMEGWRINILRVLHDADLF